MINLWWSNGTRFDGIDRVWRFEWLSFRGFFSFRCHFDCSIINNFGDSVLKLAIWIFVEFCKCNVQLGIVIGAWVIIDNIFGLSLVRKLINVVANFASIFSKYLHFNCGILWEWIEFMEVVFENRNQVWWIYETLISYRFFAGRNYLEFFIRTLPYSIMKRIISWINQMRHNCVIGRENPTASNPTKFGKEIFGNSGTFLKIARFLQLRWNQSYSMLEG